MTDAETQVLRMPPLLLGFLAVAAVVNAVIALASGQWMFAAVVIPILGMLTYHVWHRSRHVRIEVSNEGIAYFNGAGELRIRAGYDEITGIDRFQRVRLLTTRGYVPLPQWAEAKVLKAVREHRPDLKV